MKHQPHTGSMRLQEPQKLSAEELKKAGEELKARIKTREAPPQQAGALKQNALAQLDAEEQQLCTELHGLLLEEKRTAGGARPLLSILKQLVRMTPNEINRCIDLYEGSSLSRVETRESQEGAPPRQALPGSPPRLSAAPAPEQAAEEADWAWSFAAPPGGAGGGGGGGGASSTSSWRWVAGQWSRVSQHQGGHGGHVGGSQQDWNAGSWSWQGRWREVGGARGRGGTAGEEEEEEEDFDEQQDAEDPWQDGMDPWANVAARTSPADAWWHNPRWDVPMSGKGIEYDAEEEEEGGKGPYFLLPAGARGGAASTAARKTGRKGMGKSNKLHISNLRPDVSREDLRRVFNRYGRIVGLYLSRPPPPRSGGSAAGRGSRQQSQSAYIVFSNWTEAQQCVTAAGSYDSSSLIGDGPLEVSYADDTDLRLLFSISGGDPSARSAKGGARGGKQQLYYRPMQ